MLGSYGDGNGEGMFEKIKVALNKHKDQRISEDVARQCYSFMILFKGKFVMLLTVNIRLTDH